MVDKKETFLEKYFKEIIIITSVMVIGLTFVSYIINDSFGVFYFLATDKLGQFGDFIGGFLGTILTIVTTVYIYKTYISQKEELESQRNLISQQQFESTFFNMLNVHRELKKDLDLNTNVRVCNVATYIEKPDLENLDKGLGNKVKEEIETFYKGVNVFDFIRLDFEVLYRHFKKSETQEGRNAFENYIIKKK